MAFRNSALKYLALSAIPIAVCYSCTKQDQIIDNGVLKGKISIGPLCPVERIPPDPACLPTAETYKAWATAVWTLKNKAKVADINPNPDGIYEIGLPAGDYIIDFNVVHTNTVGRSNLPSVISIVNMDTTIFNINIDTGIRSSEISVMLQQ